VKLQQLITKASLHYDKVRFIVPYPPTALLFSEHDCRLNRTMFDVLRILRGSQIEKKPITELFERPLNKVPEICNDLGCQLSFNFQ
jgi:hypothetical protein